MLLKDCKKPTCKTTVWFQKISRKSLISEKTSSSAPKSDLFILRLHYEKKKKKR